MSGYLGNGQLESDFVFSGKAGIFVTLSGLGQGQGQGLKGGCLLNWWIFQTFRLKGWTIYFCNILLKLRVG
jgi:hypothetical protein